MDPCPPWLSLAEGCHLLGRGLPPWLFNSPAPWQDGLARPDSPRVDSQVFQLSSLVQLEGMRRGWGGAAG